MKKILLVSGCSWTDKAFVSDFHPELDTSWPKWPEILGEMLDMEVINLGKSGQGNEYIYSSLLDRVVGMSDEDRSRIGLVIAAWSGAQRRDWEKTPWRKYPPPGRNHTPPTYQWCSDRYDTKGDVYYFINRLSRCAMSLQILCERYNIPYMQVQMIPVLGSFAFGRDTTDPADPAWVKSINSTYTQALLKLEESDYLQKLDGDKWLPYWPPFYTDDWSMKNYVFSSDTAGWGYRPDSDHERYVISKQDRHPNAEGQKLIAGFINEHI